jgi:hypothetical protein
MNAPRVFKYLLIGFLAGGAVSVLPFPLNVLLALVFICVWLVRFIRRAPGAGSTHFITAGVGLATVVVAILLPVKQLDGVVGPFRYEQMSLDGLCQALSRDHRIFVSADRRTGTNVLISFSTDRAVTRRVVLQKLAQEAGCDLHIGYCGTGATFLFGAHPSFTRLEARIARPDDAANGIQPFRLETNPTSSAAGSRR